MIAEEIPGLEIVPATDKRVNREEMVAMLKEYTTYRDLAADYDKYRKKYMVALLDGKPVGFAMGYKNNDNFVFNHPFVKPAFRGKGVGKALFNHAYVLAAKNNCEVIHIPIVGKRGRGLISRVKAANPRRARLGLLNCTMPDLEGDINFRAVVMPHRTIRGIRK